MILPNAFGMFTRDCAWTTVTDEWPHQYPARTSVTANRICSRRDFIGFSFGPEFYSNAINTTQNQMKTSNAPGFLRTANIDENKKSKLSVISLFSGCGGMDLGVIQAGWDVRVMVEWEKAACNTLRANFTMEGLKAAHRWRIDQFRKQGDLKAAEKLAKRKVHVPNWYRSPEPAILQSDITKTTTQEILEAARLKVGECGMVTGGFPCQGFSMAGNRMINDPRNQLYKECVRIVREALPKAFLFENVAGLITMAKGTIIDQICKDLADCGYDVSWQKLDAADYGVPQHRVRVFFTGFRRDALVFLAKGKPRMYLGVAPGRYKHPDFFEKKFSIPSNWPQDALAA